MKAKFIGFYRLFSEIFEPAEAIGSTLAREVYSYPLERALISLSTWCSKRSFLNSLPLQYFCWYGIIRVLDGVQFSLKGSNCAFRYYKQTRIYMKDLKGIHRAEFLCNSKYRQPSAFSDASTWQAYIRACGWLLALIDWELGTHSGPPPCQRLINLTRLISAIADRARDDFTGTFTRHLQFSNEFRTVCIIFTRKSFCE